MARPTLVEKLHEAKFELRLAPLNQKDALLKKYHGLLEALRASLKEDSGIEVTQEELRHSLTEDYNKFLKEEGLPRLRAATKQTLPPPK